MLKQIVSPIGTSQNTKLLNAKQLSLAVGSFSEKAIWRLHRQGRIPCIKLGRRTIRYDLNAVLSALAKFTVAEGSI